MPMRHATRLAKLEEIEAAMREQRPMHVPPELPLCPAKDLKVPNGYMQAVNSEHGELGKGSMDREWHGIKGEDFRRGLNSNQWRIMSMLKGYSTGRQMSLATRQK